MSFQEKTIKILAFILIITLILVGIVIYHSQKSAPWPPYVALCPDFFEVDSNGKCLNNKALGGTQGMTLENNVPKYNNPPGATNGVITPIDFSGKTLKEKYEWSITNNLTWEGITNNPVFTS